MGPSFLISSDSCSFKCTHLDHMHFQFGMHGPRWALQSKILVCVLSMPYITPVNAMSSYMCNLIDLHSPRLQADSIKIMSTVSEEDADVRTLCPSNVDQSDTTVHILASSAILQCCCAGHRGKKDGGMCSHQEHFPAYGTAVQRHRLLGGPCESPSVQHRCI